MKFILGIKLGMSQIFTDSGEVVPMTLIKAGPVVVTQIKTKEKDGYQSIQVGFEKKKEKRVKKPQKDRPYRWLKEFKTDQALKPGDIIDVSVFQPGEKVKVSGISKGKGFAGAMKRHGFHGMPASHGHKHVTRKVGSIGQRFPQHTLKGTKMAGHAGSARITVKGLEIVKTDKEKNILVLKGAVPGARGAFLEIMTQ